MLKTNDTVVDFFRGRLKTELGYHLKTLILFGSKARGDAHVASDYDCLVVVDEITPRIKDIIDTIAGETLYSYDSL